MMLKVGEETWDYETHGSVILTAVEKKGKNVGMAKQQAIYWLKDYPTVRREIVPDGLPPL